MWVRFQSLLSCAFCEREGHHGHSHPPLIIGTGSGRGMLAYKLASLGKTILPLEDGAEK